MFKFNFLKAYRSVFSNKMIVYKELLKKIDSDVENESSILLDIGFVNFYNLLSPLPFLKDVHSKPRQPMIENSFKGDLFSISENEVIEKDVNEVVENTDKIVNSLIKKNDNTYKVKILSPFSHLDFRKLFSKYCEDGDKKWKNIEIVDSTYENPDFNLIINSTNEKVDYKKSIVFRMEPFVEKHRRIWGDFWFNPPKEDFFRVYGHPENIYPAEWHISLNIEKLINQPIVKPSENDKKLSLILSDKYEDIGQKLRIDFARYIDKKTSIDLDAYGGNRNSYKNYKGSPQSHEKDVALLPYKYTFNAENHSIKNYVTEKLYDAILSETLCFYWGPVNIEKIIDPRAFVRLELSNFEKDANIIKNAIDNDLWSERIEYIREEKKRIINEFNILNRLHQIVEGEI